MDQKKKIEMELLKNPKYSSGWIDNASHLITNCGLTEEEVSKFDTEQLQLIVSVFTSAQNNNEIWIDGFLNPELNATQMQILLTGYSHGLTTEQLKPYFNPTISYIKSNWAVSALAEGFDMGPYIINGYDEDQIYEIYSGKKDGVDISLYDCIKIPSEKMAIARHALNLGLEIHFDDNNKLTI